MAITKTRGAAPIHPGEILLEEFLKAYDLWHANATRARRKDAKIRPLAKAG